MRKDVLNIVLNQMSQQELIAAFIRVADWDQISGDDQKMEWALGFYPSINAAWIAKHGDGIRKWVMENISDVKEMKIEEAPNRNPWYDITVRALSSEKQYVLTENLEQFNKIYSEVFEGITLDNAQDKIDTFYRRLRDCGISYSYYRGSGKEKVLVYALCTVTVDRDYINSLDKKAAPL